MKHSKTLKLAILPAAILLLAACGETDIESSVYNNPQECSENMDAAICNEAFKEAQIANATEAPKYSTVKQCEIEHGVGKCEQNAQSGGSFFMPMMMGYLMSSAFRGGAGGNNSKALYSRAGSSNLSTAGGTSVSGTGKTKVSPSAFKSTPATVNRSGFGQSAKAKSTGG
ncbi:hypothetical protein AwWohl_11840 [Gammaproteobacteria bacterium]|nr:hypothetical protein AwWohl_11840 [Gammaproteobacteria bacterium]